MIPRITFELRVREDRYDATLSSGVHNIKTHAVHSNRAAWIAWFVASIKEQGPCDVYFRFANGKEHRISQRLIETLLTDQLTAEDLTL